MYVSKDSLNTMLFEKRTMRSSSLLSFHFFSHMPVAKKAAKKVAKKAAKKTVKKAAKKTAKKAAKKRK